MATQAWVGEQQERRTGGTSERMAALPGGLLDVSRRATRGGPLGQPRTRALLRELLVSAAAGFLATVPMSAFLEGVRMVLPRREQYPWPPHGEITASLAHKADLEEQIGEAPFVAATVLGHLGYGALSALAYPLTAGRLRRGALLGDLVYGLVVWAAGYAGWLPALRILTPPTEQPPRRTASMIAAHLVWAALVGATVRAFRPAGRPPSS